MLVGLCAGQITFFIFLIPLTTDFINTYHSQLIISCFDKNFFYDIITCEVMPYLLQ